MGIMWKLGEDTRWFEKVVTFGFLGPESIDRDTNNFLSLFLWYRDTKKFLTLFLWYRDIENLHVVQFENGYQRRHGSNPIGDLFLNGLLWAKITRVIPYLYHEVHDSALLWASELLSS